MRSDIFWQEFWLLVGFGVIALLVNSFTLAKLQRPIMTRSTAVSREPQNEGANLVGSFIGSFVRLLLTISIGLILAHAVGLDLQLARSIANGQMSSRFIVATLIPTVVVGVSCGIVMLTFIPRSSSTRWQTLLAAYSNGILQELVYRLFVLSLIVWLLAKVWLPNISVHQQGALWIFWAGTAGGAFVQMLGVVLFAAFIRRIAGGSQSSVFPSGRVALVTCCTGIAFGYLYWRYGLESAVVAHIMANLIVEVRPPAVSQSKAMAAITLLLQAPSMSDVYEVLLDNKKVLLSRVTARLLDSLMQQHHERGDERAEASLVLHKKLLEESREVGVPTAWNHFEQAYSEFVNAYVVEAATQQAASLVHVVPNQVGAEALTPVFSPPPGRGADGEVAPPVRAKIIDGRDITQSWVDFGQAESGRTSGPTVSFLRKPATGILPTFKVGTIERWLLRETRRDQRRFLENHLEIVDERAEQYLQALLKSALKHSSELEKLGAMNTIHVAGSIRNLYLCSQILTEARASGSSIASVRHAYVEALGGLVLDVPQWLLALEQRMFVTGAFQGNRIIQAFPILDAMLKDAKADANLPLEVLAALYLEWAKALHDVEETNDKRRLLLIKDAYTNAMQLYEQAHCLRQFDIAERLIDGIEMELASIADH